MVRNDIFILLGSTPYSKGIWRAHGPLARAVLGQQQVQGLDYAYTLQGWMKGLNSTALSPAFDMGGDGKEGPVLNPVARDAFGFSLHYYDSTDYLPIKAGQTPFAAVAGLGSDFRPLYNGNIASMAVNLPKVGEPMLYNYHYDQLNRLAGMDAWKGLQAGGNNWQPVKTDDYKERIKYDANGNITSYLRHGAAAIHGLSMDSMRYQYERDAAGRLVNNRLMFVRDFAGGSYTDDIKDQDVDNYAYDAIGNLIRDSASGILKVDWNVYGKISRIIKKRGNDLGSNEKDTIIYHYDAGGNRIAKQIGGDHTYYVRDASGNIMSIYSVHDSVNDGRLTQSEIDLYGSSRLGVYNPRRDVEAGGAPAFDRFSVVRGWKNYELTNHLGNVLATVSDRKLQVRSATDTTMIGYYEADVLTSNDYYPGGMQQPGQEWQVGTRTYRYSINGQERESELNKNITTALYWEYDSRLVRRWNVDPRPSKAISPYSCFIGNPIVNSDRFGDTPIVQMGNANYSLARGNGNSLKYLNSSGNELIGPMTLNAMNTKDAFENSLKSPTSAIAGRANDLLDSKFNLYITEDQAAIGNQGVASDALYAFRLSNGSIVPASNTQNQPKDAMAAYISLSGIGSTVARGTPGNDIRSHGGSQLPGPATPSVLSAVHEIFGHGWQASKKILNSWDDRIQYWSGGTLLGGAPKVEADAVMISNIYALHNGMGNLMQRYYPETPPGSNQATLHEIPWGFLLGTLTTNGLILPKP